MQRPSKKTAKNSPSSKGNDKDPNQKRRRQVGRPAAPSRGGGKKASSHLYMGLLFFCVLLGLPILSFIYDVKMPWYQERYTIRVAEKSKLGVKAAQYLVEKSKSAITLRGKFVVALSGGSMPKVLRAGMAEVPGLKESTDWNKWHVIWADERCVGFDSDDSTFKAWKGFFSEVGIPKAQIYNIKEDLVDDASAAAADYEQRLNALLNAGQEVDVSSSAPIDVVMLGMGGDGHTASLFPSHALLHESEKKVAPITDSPKPPSARITLTLPFINAARAVAFLVTGTGKAPAVATIMGTSEQARAQLHVLGLRKHRHIMGTLIAQQIQKYFALHTEHAASLVRPKFGTMTWFLDTEAAGSLPPP